MNPLRDYRNFSRGGGQLPPDGQSAKAIVAKVIEERSQGLAVTDEQVLSEHPGLRDELKHELGVADQIRQAMLSARYAAAVHGERPFLTESEFDESIAALKNEAVEKPPGSEETLPQIPGYLLLNEINRGGQAAVYRAIQESTRRSVAIKVISGGPFVISRHRVRFERETRILAALDHPNIVSIIERGRTPDGSFFFVMQFIDGLPMDEHWTAHLANDAGSLRELVQLFRKAALAMEEAHARGVVHRDLKPSNILVDRRGEPHVLDFGLARPADETPDLAVRSMTMPGQIIGSLPWASPEQAAGQSNEMGAASDVYSLGIILFQALTGDFPYSREGPIDQVLLRIRTLRAAAPSKHPGARKGVDGRLDAIVLKALAKAPQDRYCSAGAMAKDLEAWLAGRTISAISPARRRKRGLIAILSVLVVGFTLAASAWKAPSAGTHVFQLPVLTNSVGMKLVQIPSGDFSMGSPATESGRSRDETQRRKVVDHSFYIATTVVTQQQYEMVMHQNPSDARWRGPNLPVENVSWDQAVEFCRRLGESEHAHYRLPTEVEWEYACRAGNTSDFPDHAHPGASALSVEYSGGSIRPVATRLPNAWGLYDMQGNVCQWCSDIYSRDGEDRQALPERAPLRVRRGGSALEPLVNCRAAARSKAPQTLQNPDLGFRVVRNP